MKDDAAEEERTNGSEAFCARSQHVVLRAGVFADERRHLFARSLASSLAPTSEHRGIARRKKAVTQSVTNQKPKERRATTTKKMESIVMSFLVRSNHTTYLRDGGLGRCSPARELGPKWRVCFLPEGLCETECLATATKSERERERKIE